MNSTAAPNLERVLSYENPEVVFRIQRETKLSHESSEVLFTELKRWLWACANVGTDFKNGKVSVPELLISPELESIDKAWHCFLLFTLDYKNFCETYLGRFIHHTPLSSEKVAAFEKICLSDRAEALKIRQEELRPQLNYLFDLIGPDKLKLWYKDLPKI